MKLHLSELSETKLITILFIIISTLIVLFTLTGKFIFTLDLIPRLNYYGLTNSVVGLINPLYGGYLPFNVIQSIISSTIFQRLLFFSILLISGLSFYHAIPVNSLPARLFASLLYMLNPYVYVRILAGHWLLLFGYAVLPLAMKSFMNLLECSNRRNIIRVVLLTTLVGFNSHTLIMALIAYFIFFCLKAYRMKDVDYTQRLIKSVILAAIIFFLLNSYWLLQLMTAKDTLINSIGTADLAAFAPRIESFSALFTLASMHGFWREGYVYAKDFLPFWQVLFIFILFLAVHGFISYYRNEKIGVYVKSFAIIAIVGLALAAGAQSLFSEIFRWLFDHTMLKGMRDSHKFVTLLVLAYAYLGALGVSEFEKSANNTTGRYKKLAALAVIAAALVTPFVYSFTFFNGFAGQIKPTDYPADWYEVNDFLNNDVRDFKVLFLPWHQYMNFNWVPNKDKRIANPAPYFFDKEVISGKNIEIGGIYRQVNSPDQLYIDFLLKEQKNITNFGELLAPLNIKFILLTKEVDYKKHFFLFNQSDIELVKETENFYVFRNRREIAKIYEVDSVTYISGWDELLERSRNENITERFYLIGSPQGNTQEISDKKSLDYEKESPMRYTLQEGTSKKYLVFTEPYLETWEFGGKKPMQAYGVVNAYVADGADGMEISYERFYNIYLPSYIISILTFAVLIMFYFDLHKKIPGVTR